MALPHSALAPSGQPIWLDMARRSARALSNLRQRGLTTRDILTDAAIHNAMVVHAAFGGSTNLLLHIPAIAFAAGLRAADGRRLARDQSPGAAARRRAAQRPDRTIPTVRVFLAGGVPEVMLHLRELGLLRLDALTVTGEPLGDVLDWWETSERRAAAARAAASSRTASIPTT